MWHPRRDRRDLRGIDDDCDGVVDDNAWTPLLGTSFELPPNRPGKFFDLTQTKVRTATRRSATVSSSVLARRP